MKIVIKEFVVRSCLYNQLFLFTLFFLFDLIYIVYIH
jgi:hypothetical protein